MKKFLSALRPYSALAALYLLAIVVMKLAEALTQGAASILAQVLVYNLIVASWTLLGLGVVYVLIDRVSHKAALLTATLVLAVLTLSELGLTLYATHNGYLLDSELLARPLSETLFTIRGAVGLALPIVLIVLALALYVALALWIDKRNWRGPQYAWIAIAIFVLLSIIFPVNHLLDHWHDTQILNKTHYLVTDCCRYWRSDKSDGSAKTQVAAYDAEKIERLLATHPEWPAIDKQYPLERLDNIEDVLSAYFAESGTRPNVVVVLVESLGDEFMGTGLMPFVDSLAGSGLYWKNCLSTTTRSYGAIPAITGSVGGPKSFQFGMMPQHNSMLSLLKKAGYRTGAYYGGYFAFDCIYDYLQAQGIDYMSPFYDEFKSLKDDSKGAFWGYHDGVLLERTLEELPVTATPQCNLVVTLTMHEDLQLSDEKAQNSYTKQAQEALKRCKLDIPVGRAASCRYTDDALRKFFADYAKRSDFKNTIFVVTGDHASGLVKQNNLSLHHVPLIIASPLLQTRAQFDYLVTHNDVAPSMCELLKNRYGVAMPETVHWLGNGLAQGDKTMLIVNYNREIQEMVWNGCYYHAGNQWEGERVCKIGNDLSLTEMHDAELLNQCREQMGLLKYLYAYTYTSNRLTQHPVVAARKYDAIRTFSRKDKVFCITPAEKPSEAGPTQFYLLTPMELKKTAGYDWVRLTLNADVLIQDSLWQDQYMHLAFKFQGDETVIESDHISKYVDAEVLHKDSLYHIQLTREFPLSEKESNRASIFIETAKYDDAWVPNSRLTIMNTKINIDYGK